MNGPGVPVPRLSLRRLALAAALLAGAAWTCRDRPLPPPRVGSPAYTEVEGALRDVYDTARWSVKVPVEWARGELVAGGLAVWVATLPLPDGVRARVNARIGSDGLVDELVPFALFVKQMYDAPAPADFATWARANVPRDASVPGLEHALFSFTPPADHGSKPSLPPAQAAKLIELYDAIWLRDADPAAPLDERLACDAMTDDALAARAAAAAPVVRDLLASVRDSARGETRATLDHVLGDPAVLDALSLTLVELVNVEVCKHYRIFAARTVRTRQLREWLEADLLEGGDASWDWLRWQATRPRAVHVVVDGLQGHLVEALAAGEPGDPFLARLVEEERTDAVRPQVPAVPGPATSNTFLHHVAANGHADPTFLPFFRSLYASPAGIARQGISTTPTISVRNLPVAKTGAPVAGDGGTGIPNFHFVDRTFALDGVVQGRPWYFYGNDALQLTRLARESGMRTMFERLDRLVTMSCGAQYDEAAGYSFDAFFALALGEHVRDFGELRCVAELGERARNEARIVALRDALLAREPVLRVRHRPWEVWDRWRQSNERAAARDLVRELADLEPRGMPDYLLWYDPWPDHMAHARGPFSDEIVSPTGELARLDHWLGVISEQYSAAGLADRTLFGMAGDHGLAPVHWIVSPEALVLDGLARDGIPLVVRKISSDEGEGPKLTHRLRPPSMRGLDVVVASTAGGNYMLDLFVDQGESWGRQPVLGELRQLRTLGGATVDIVGELTTRLGDSLDYLVVREAPCDASGGVVQVIGPRNGVLGTGRIERSGDRIRYTWTGADVLGVPAGACPDGCTEPEWRALTAGTDRPDSVVQLAHLYDTDRAGTINLFPRAGVGYNTSVPGRHAGESFHEKDAFVGVWGAPLAEGPRLDAAVNGEVPMVLHRWLTGTPSREGRDGWGYPATPVRLRGE